MALYTRRLVLTNNSKRWIGTVDECLRNSTTSQTLIIILRKLSILYNMDTLINVSALSSLHEERLEHTLLHGSGSNS